jgi:predicted O-methyltransferase YrrM
MYGTVLPEFLGEPFRFLVERTISAPDLPVVEKIEAMRTNLAKRNREFVGVFEGDQLGAKGARPKSLAEVAWVVSILPLWGTFLYLCAKASGAKTILELGGGVGISGCYLASAPSCTRFVTIEGHPDRAQLAEPHLRQMAQHAEVINTPFEDGLREIFPTVDAGIDLVFIDGARRWETTYGLLSRMMLHLNPQCIVILDDIHLSAETRETWKEMRRLQGFAYAISAGRLGVCGWDGGEGRPETGTLFGFAGIDFYGARRRMQRG